MLDIRLSRSGDIELMAIAWNNTAIRSFHPIRVEQNGHPKDLYIRLSYVLLHQIDLVLTVLAVSAGLSELNPIIRSMLGLPLQLVLLKLIIPLAIAWFAPGKLLIPAIVFLLIVICWNLKELFMLVL